MVLGALLILAAAALLAYNKWDASRADKASQEVLGELEQTLNAAIEEKAKSDTVALQPELDPTQEMTVTELNGWDYIGYLSRIIFMRCPTSAAAVWPILVQKCVRRGLSVW